MSMLLRFRRAAEAAALPRSDALDSAYDEERERDNEIVQRNLFTACTADFTALVQDERRQGLCGDNADEYRGRFETGVQDVERGRAGGSPERDGSRAGRRILARQIEAKGVSQGRERQGIGAVACFARGLVKAEQH